MSITSRIDPSGFVSVQDNLWHIATSSKSGEVNFKYVFDVYDASGTQLVRVKNYPDPANGKGYFDAGNVVRNIIRYEWFEPQRLVTSPFNTALPPLRHPYINQPSTSGEIAATYRIAVGEDYASGNLQITDLNLSSGNIKAYNYIPKLFGRRKWTLADVDRFKLLSNRYRTVKYDKSQDNHLYVGWFGNRNDNTFNWNFSLYAYDASNTQILVQGIYPENSYPDKLFYQMDLGYKALNDFINNELNTEEGRAYEDYLANAKYLIIEFDGGLIPTLDKLRIDLECSANENISLHFMNAYGMFDTAIFRGANKLNMNVSRKAFEQNEYNFGNTSVDYYDSNGVYYESKINYSQFINHAYKLIYEYPNDEEYAWLAELIYSPLIYMEKDGNLYPVTIKNTNYQYNQVRYDRLKNLEIEIEINQNRRGFLR